MYYYLAISMENEVRNALAELDKRITELEKRMPSQERPVRKTTKTSILDLLMQLKSDGFFDEPKSLKQIVDKLAENRYHYAQESLTAPLQRAVRKGLLGRIKKDDKWAYAKR